MTLYSLLRRLRPSNTELRAQHVTEYAVVSTNLVMEIYFSGEEGRGTIQNATHRFTARQLVHTTLRRIPSFQ